MASDRALAADRLRRAVGSLWIRAAVTAGLLALVALRVDWHVAADRLSAGRWGWFAVAVALLLGVQAVGAVRWLLLLRTAEVHSSWSVVVRAYAIGFFSNNFLPTAFGGDAARAWIVARSGPRLVRALTSVVVDRATGLWCLVAVAWIGLAADRAAVPGSLVLGLLAATAGGVLAPALLCALALRSAGGSALPARLREWMREARDTLRIYAGNTRVLGIASALGLALQALTVTALWSAVRAIGLDLPFSLLAVAAPLVLMITLVPISIAGFGVREGGTVLVLGAAGVSATDATLVSLIGVAAMVVAGVAGAVAMISPRPASAPARAGMRGRRRPRLPQRVSPQLLRGRRQRRPSPRPVD